MEARSPKIRIKDVPNLKPALYSAIGGDAAQALKDLEQLDESSLSDREREVTKIFRQRFAVNHSPEKSSSKELVDQVIYAFHVYWKKALLGEVSGVEGYRYLFDRLVPLAIQRGYVAKEFGEEEAERLANFLQEELSKDGFHSLFGRVKPFLNVMIWGKESLAEYEVEIGESEKQKVSVVFLDDFAELGWGAYATLKVMHVGGWAKEDKLYCVKSAYDLESESFRVNYLAHEARHFADYKIFPKLEQLDLEYRAKLTELFLADSLYKDVLDKFLHEQKEDRSVPHAYASYLLVKGLSEKVGSNNLVAADQEKVQQAARQLVVEHTEAAKSRGAEAVESVFE